MKIQLSLATTAALALASMNAGALAQQTVYAIGSGGGTLISFQTNNPGAVTVVGTFGGGATFLDAIDFRPATGQLFGYLDSTDSFYTVNLANAQLTTASVGVSGGPTNTFQLGMDFNPAIDRLRVVTDSGQNIVFNPNSGTAAPFTALAYAIGDANENTSPSIIDNAYSRNTAGTATTQQYAIDYGIDALVTVANNAGTLATIGSLGVNTDIYTGFDIFTSGATDTAYAILTPLGGVASFYTINLTTGQATLVGAIGYTGQIYSLAVVPAPGATVVAGLALAAFGVRRRR